MNRKTIFAIILITGILLMIPLIAMQFTLEVVWTPMDFLIAGVLLLCAGFALVYLWKKLAQSNYRLYIIVGLILLFLMLWAELAIGIFGSPIAGN